jgi:hypothetical protein
VERKPGADLASETGVDGPSSAAQALIELGERQVNAIARNYYLWSATFLLRDLSQVGTPTGAGSNGAD